MASTLACACHNITSNAHIQAPFPSSSSNSFSYRSSASFSLKSKNLLTSVSNLNGYSPISRLPIVMASSGQASQAVEQEQMTTEKPSTLLREGEGEASDAPGLTTMRSKFEKMIRKAQDEICAAVESVDGAKFREDAWIRPGGGGGISRVLQDGNVWEKAGVNVSVVYGTMPPEAYRAATGGGEANGAPVDKAGRIPFFASGISSVMHPKNPFAPTVHFNYRYFETDTPEGVSGAPRAWWFGGGTDLTPSYLFEEDAVHFHQQDLSESQYLILFKRSS